MQIFIRTLYGKVLAVDVEPEMTIGEIKKKIGAKYQIPMEEMCMIFKGNILKDVTTIDEAGIRKEDLLNIVKALEKESEEIELLVRFDDRESFPMTFRPSDTIKEVKAKVYEKTDMGGSGEPDIYYRGQRLENHITIKEAGVKKKDMLLMCRFLKC